MNSLLLISPDRAWGFKPILSGKGDKCDKCDRQSIREKLNVPARSMQVKCPTA
ncbi:hypothetical protein Q5692_06235 [Microcoleus sp. C2C3]|uniref:hypothetical protein n=1 Tax=unclassified Microcoleus TaxID=2642155 RepID=UPI002FCF35F3